MTRTVRTDQGAQGSRSGITLVVVVLVMMALVVLGLTAFTMSAVDTRTAGHYKTSLGALYQADAGVQYVVNQIRADIDAGSLVLDSPTETVSYTAPSGFNFDPVTTLYRLADGNCYLFSVTGHALLSETTVEAVTGPDYLEFELYSDDKMDIGNESTVQASVRSNNEIKLSGTALVDGNATPGPGFSVVYAPPADVTGTTAPPTEPFVVDPIPPADIAAALADNNNAALDPAYYDAGTKSLLVPGGTTTIPAGTYYFTEIKIEAGASVQTSGKAEIYCVTKMQIDTSNVNDVGGNPSDFILYYSGGDAVDIGGGSVVYARIYAPNAKYKLSGNSQYYGSLITGLDFQTSGSSDFFAVGKWGTGSGVRLVSWKQVAW